MERLARGISAVRGPVTFVPRHLFASEVVLARAC
jgi:hypothetical protein